RSKASGRVLIRRFRGGAAPEPLPEAGHWMSPFPMEPVDQPRSGVSECSSGGPESGRAVSALSYQPSISVFGFTYMTLGMPLGSRVVSAVHRNFSLPLTFQKVFHFARFLTVVSTCSSPNPRQARGSRLVGDGARCKCK